MWKYWLTGDQDIFVSSLHKKYILFRYIYSDQINDEKALPLTSLPISLCFFSYRCSTHLPAHIQHVTVCNCPASL